jgi:hypothetical protein
MRWSATRWREPADVVATRTQATDYGVKKLQQASPNCKVNR